MTHISTTDERYTRFQAVFASAVLMALMSAIFIGLNLVTAKNCIILPRSPFEKYEFAEAVIRICAWDVVLIWILTIPLSRVMTVLSSCAVFFFRGLIIGNACRVFFENSVTSAAVTVLISYLGVTVLSLVYDAFLNGFGDRSVMCRIISCLIVTGACALIRVLPMLML